MVNYSINKGYRKNRRKPYFILGSLLVITAGYAAINNTRRGVQSPPIINAQFMSQPATMMPVPLHPKITTSMPWPNYGQAAYGVIEDGHVAQSSEEAKAVPIASLAKVITALAVIKQKPLAPDEQGPVITITEEDLALYREYVAKSGTVIPVEAGSQISQYQALQAMLLPSANNISDTLVRWAFGSMEEYNAYANKMLGELGFADTSVADASGFSPLTTSTASEMVKIGMLYMQNPVLQEIALQPKATIPFAGVVVNNNATVNKDGVIGLKVGYTEEAGNTFLVADLKGINNNEISVAVVLGARNMSIAMLDAKALLKSGNIGHKQLSDN